MGDEPQAYAVSRAALAQGARAHYDRLSMAACDWYSLIPEAIAAWEHLPALEAEIDAQAARLVAAERFHDLGAHTSACQQRLGYGGCEPTCSRLRAIIAGPAAPARADE